MAFMQVRARFRIKAHDATKCLLNVKGSQVQVWKFGASDDA